MTLKGIFRWTHYQRDVNMKSRFPQFIPTVLFILLTQFLLAQSDSLQANRDTSIISDSLEAALTKEYTEKMLNFERQRRQDSILRANLIDSLNSLKTTDNLQKEELQKQLQELRQQEIRRIALKKAQIDSLKQIVVGFPVIGFFDDTLFTIFSKHGSLTAPERAENARRKIIDLGGDRGFRIDSLKINDVENITEILFGPNTIMIVCEADAFFADTTRTGLANKYADIITKEVLYYQSETSLKELVKEIGLAILVIILTWVFIFYTNRFFNWVKQKVRDQEGKLFSGYKIRDYTLFDAKSQVNALTNVIWVLKWLIIFLIFYISLPILFGIFPWTEDFAPKLFSYILYPINKTISGFLSYLPNLITIIVILIVFRYVLKGFKFLRDEIAYEHLHIPGFFPDWASPTYQIIRILTLAFLIVVIFPYLPGSDSPVFRGVSVFLGFLFTFGSAGSLSHIIAGIILTYMRLFKIGDRVKIGNVSGDVVEKSLLVTRIRTIKNEIISIPNSTVMNSHAINYSSDAPVKGLIIHSTVTIGYDVPWRKMHKVLIEAAQRTELVLKEPEPFVLQTSLDDYYVSYQINAYIRQANKQATIYSELHQHIQDVCNENDIEILSPHYRAARDGNMTTIPEEYLPKDYKIPGFNLFVNKDKDKPAE